MLHVVAAAIVRDGRVYAARRPLHKREGGNWELPGGKVEPGESEVDALVREIAEELGCVVRPDARIGESRVGDVRLCAYRCALVAGEPALTEHIDARWLGASELGLVRWAEADVPLLDAIFPRA